jgi:arginine kinase
MTRDERLGFVTVSPENLGNTIKMSIRLKLDKLPLKPGKIDDLAENFSVSVQKLEREVEDVYEVASKRRLGLTEFDTVKSFAAAINSIIEAENSL